MKRVVLVAIVMLAVIASGVSAQTTIKGMAFNGATGLIATPTAQIGWERTANVGLDFGFHYINDDAGGSAIPKINVSLFRKVEVGLAYDTMGPGGDNSSAFMIPAKFQFYQAGVSAAGFGTNIQFGELNGDDFNAVQIYLVGTYGGQFFGMPAATTVVFGKTFSDLVDDGNLDFSMGFELTLLPEVFRGHVQWLNDFSNYSYQVRPTGARPDNRGAYNTGLRILPIMGGQYKFVIDAFLTDVFDGNDRAFALGGTFGLGLR